MFAAPENPRLRTIPYRFGFTSSGWEEFIDALLEEVETDRLPTRREASEVLFRLWEEHTVGVPSAFTEDAFQAALAELRRRRTQAREEAREWLREEMKEAAEHIIDEADATLSALRDDAEARFPVDVGPEVMAALEQAAREIRDDVDEALKRRVLRQFERRRGG